jgi:hypothetical protein
MKMDEADEVLEVDETYLAVCGPHSDKSGANEV